MRLFMQYDQYGGASRAWRRSARRKQQLDALASSRQGMVPVSLGAPSQWVSGRVNVDGYGNTTMPRDKKALT